MRDSIAETVTGFLVLLIAAFFVYNALSETGARAGGSHEVFGARFNNIGGLGIGTDVRLSGVKVGTVRSMKLDTETYEALVKFTVRDDLALGDGTTIRVQTDALLGGSYLGLEPGDGFGPITPCAHPDELFGKTGCGEILYAQGSKDLFTLALSALGGGSGE